MKEFDLLVDETEEKYVRVGIVKEDHPVQISKKVTKSFPIYDHRAIEYIAERAKLRVKRKFDCPILITGERRTGKTTVGIQIALKIDPDFSVDDMAFRLEQFNESLHKHKVADPKNDKYPQTLLDEAGFDLFSQNWMDRVQRNLVRKFEVIGAKNLVVYLILPHRKMLNKGMREGMCNFWIHTDTIDYERGFAQYREGYGGPWELEKFWPIVFLFTFPPLRDTVFQSKYLAKKMEFINEVTGGDDGLDLPDNKLRVQRDILIKKLRERGASTLELGEAIGLDHSRISKICSFSPPVDI